MRPLPSSIALLLVLTTHASRTAGAACGTDTIRVVEGGNAECNCTGINVTGLRLTWIPDNAECDEPLDPGDHSRWDLKTDGEECRLIIKKMRMSDRGVILLESSSGQRQVKLFIEPVCTALHIQSATDNTTDEVRLTCRSGGDVAPEVGIQWTYQGQNQPARGSTVLANLQHQGLWSCTYKGQTAGFCLVESRISEIKEPECEGTELTPATRASDRLSPSIIEIALATAGCLLVVVAGMAGVYFYSESKKALISPYVSEPADSLRQSRLTCHPDYSYNNGDCGHSMEMPYVPMTKQGTSQADGETEEHYDYENVSETLNVQDDGNAQSSSLHQQNPLYLCNDTLYGDVA
uniref:Uncharacterized protein LOC116942842 n=1 Tax=Petromyzon marinus TaxID=7757 RepID=A0AAJ7WV91_PETMA|nr:uncharacterized protein LOC116942842 [Petromyzon marinus]